MATREVYTSKGWERRRVIHGHAQLSEDDVCCDCDQPATRVTFAGRQQTRSRQPGAPILWAHCDGCAGESWAASVDARRQAEFDCEVR